MDNPLDLAEEPDPDISAKNAWITIWTHPRLTFNTALRDFPNKYVIFIFAFSGLANTPSLQLFSPIFNRSYVLSASFTIAGAMLFAYVLNELFAWAYAKTGVYLCGKASVGQFRTVTAWAFIPLVLAAIFSFADVVMSIQNSIQQNVEIENNLIASILPILEVLKIILTIWSIVLMVIGTVLIQKFGYVKAIINLLIPFVLLIVIAFIFALLYSTYV